MSAPSDRALGIRARRAVEVEHLGLEGPTEACAERYEPSPPEALDELLLGLDLAPERTTFVDLGCGKGRVICQAACRPFRRIVGVEASRTLAAVARDNVACMNPELRRAAEVEVRHLDAARFEFPAGPLILYMYNPFRGPVLERVLDNLRRRMAAEPDPRRFLLYFEPMQRAAVEARPEVALDEDGPRWARFRLSIPT